MAELVRLVHWDGFTITDAAQVMGIPASTATAVLPTDVAPTM